MKVLEMIGIVVVSVLSTIFGSWILQLFWTWFLIPIFALPVITFSY